jgi:hypothetical protein
MRRRERLGQGATPSPWLLTSLSYGPRSCDLPEPRASGQAQRRHFSASTGWDEKRGVPMAIVFLDSLPHALATVLAAAMSEFAITKARVQMRVVGESQPSIQLWFTLMHLPPQGGVPAGNSPQKKF